MISPYRLLRSCLSRQTARFLFAFGLFVVVVWLAGFCLCSDNIRQKGQGENQPLPLCPSGLPGGHRSCAAPGPPRLLAHSGTAAQGVLINRETGDPDGLRGRPTCHTFPAARLPLEPAVPPGEVTAQWLWTRLPLGPCCLQLTQRGSSVEPQEEGGELTKEAVRKERNSAICSKPKAGG